MSDETDAPTIREHSALSERVAILSGEVATLRATLEARIVETDRRVALASDTIRKVGWVIAVTVLGAVLKEVALRGG